MGAGNPGRPFVRTDQAERGAEHGNRDARPDSCRTEGRTDCNADTEPDKNGGSLDRLAHNFSSDDPDVGLRFQHGDRVNPDRPRQPALTQERQLDQPRP
ncbi:hypothetical protein [Micromonospora phaseoli]|uniref:hypothetical protein n=1 Tax=Micromonospora phaseoli TaxID=1144548 RepID=UPI001113C4FA|nr:hypothetical protein [Micromonospora phaseoli]